MFKAEKEATELNIAHVLFVDFDPFSLFGLKKLGNVRRKGKDMAGSYLRPDVSAQINWKLICYLHVVIYHEVCF